MRLGLNNEFKLPDYIPTRGHLTLEGKKISKVEMVYWPKRFSRKISC